MPPFRYAALIRCESKDQQAEYGFFTATCPTATSRFGLNIIDIWGPIPAPMERKAGRYQSHMVLIVYKIVRAYIIILRYWWQNLLHNKPSNMKFSLDIDPQELS